MSSCEACDTAACPCGHCKPHHKPLTTRRPCELCDCQAHGSLAPAQQQLDLFGVAA